MKYTILLLTLLLGGCGLFSKPVEYTPVFSPVVCEDYGQIEPVNVIQFKFVQGVDVEGNQVLGLRGDQYSNLALTIRDTLRYINEQNDVIDYYTKCIEDHNSKALNEEGAP